jgi:hypothetical protein
MTPTGDSAHQRPIRVLGRTKGIDGERRQRSRGGATTVARSPARKRARLSNARCTGLQCDLGEVLRVPIGLESRRRHELGEDCPVAAAGAQTPAS